MNTYQVAISSNDTHSYVEFLYPENGVQWIQGESHPNGLPDAKAQAGIIGEDKLFVLMGSGTDQIQNIDKWSNVHRSGKWVYQIGSFPDGQSIVTPDFTKDEEIKERNCKNGGSVQCHSQATCNDYDYGFCCTCKEGYFGNGKSCQPNGVPLRVIGKVSGKINNQEFLDKDLQCYVHTKDGRIYLALAHVPENIRDRFQLLNPLSSIIGWLFAKTKGDIKNGYQLTGGLFNHTIELIFKSTGDKITIHSSYLGLDVYDQLKMESKIEGNLPPVEEGAHIDFGDYELLLEKVQRGTIRSNSERTYKFTSSLLHKHIFFEDQVILYDECSEGPITRENTSKLKFSRGITTYESRERIVRFAVNSKIGPVDEEDPCIEGRLTCGDHSTCNADGDSLKCICDPGYQNILDENNSLDCVDINECNSSNQVCSRDAYCINTEGSHVCHCRPGFSGDGHICEKLATCNDTRCANHEKCIMTNGVPLCTCISGFENNEDGCYASQRIPCDKDNDCAPLATCNYSRNYKDYVCMCATGYIGNGLECYPDTNLGLVDNENPLPQCHIEMCWCPSGWEFHNSMCIRESENFSDNGSGEVSNNHECRDHKECDENERCSYVSTNSRYECTCQAGYRRVDGQCMISDCLTNPFQCHMNAQCTNDGPSGYHCSCIPGFHGDGIQYCVEKNVSCDDVNNCGQNAICGYNQTSSKYVCICLPGFNGDGFNCLKQSSCKQNSSLCSKDAACLPLSTNESTCVCNEGFIGDGIDCRLKPKQKFNFLLVNQGTAIHRIPLFTPSSKLGNFVHLAYSQMAIALDIDCLKGTAYISDITGNNIINISYKDFKSESFIGQVASPEGIAVDWVSRVIFWTDSANETIEVAHLDTKKRKVLVKEDLVNPRGIAVHPYRGKIFWSDWYRASPKLEWANEDGSGRQVFLKGEHVKLPNSLAIDWFSDELCWADAGTFSINCANIDSKFVRVIVKNLTYPFGLAISQNHYYWTDWKSGKIEVAAKSDGKKKSAISLPPGGSGKPYGIAVVSEICPQASNICQYENGKCTQEQLCLPDGQGGRTCACADNAIKPCKDSRYTT